MADAFFGGAGKNQLEISFRGDGKTLFKIWITNLLLTICTLGIYYPWGKARIRKYIYSSTYLGDYNFEFHGTGKQMFWGLAKIFVISGLIFAAVVAVYVALDLESWEDTALSPVINYLILLPFAPVLGLFIHGNRRFRMAKTTYRGIRFGYRGDKKTLVAMMTAGYALTAVSLGIYYSWFINNIRQYIYGNTKFGEVEFEFKGRGSEYVGILLRGICLSVLTLGIYYFKYRKDMFNFFYQNMSFSKDGKTVEVISRATGEKFFQLISVNALIVIFTLGLGSPFAKARTLRFIAENLELEGDLDLDAVTQTEGEYSDASGDADESADFFDLDLF